MRFELIEKVWGKIQNIREEAPGVFHLVTMSEAGWKKELYAVTTGNSPEIISKEAMTYGSQIEGGYVFEIDVEGSGWELIEYELLRHRIREGMAKNDNHINHALYVDALYTAEKYPVYFGGIIPPRKTPWGFTIRVKKAAEGVYFLETDRMEWVLALAGPIWETDISAATKRIGSFLEDEYNDTPNEARYLYFRKDDSGPAIFELLAYNDYCGLRNYITSRAALETQIYLKHPEYAIWYNRMQLMGYGRCDLFDQLMISVGLSDDVKVAFEDRMKQRIEKCLHYWTGIVSTPAFLLPD